MNPSAGEMRVVDQRSSPLAALCARRVEPEARDVHVDVTAVGVERDPPTDSRRAPGLELSRVVRLGEQAGAVQREADRARAVVAGVEGHWIAVIEVVSATVDVRQGGDPVGGRDQVDDRGRRVRGRDWRARRARAWPAGPARHSDPAPCRRHRCSRSSSSKPLWRGGRRRLRARGRRGGRRRRLRRGRRVSPYGARGRAEAGCAGLRGLRRGGGAPSRALAPSPPRAWPS